VILSSQLSLCCYLAKHRPFEKRWLNRLEILNNVFVLFTIYFLYFFAGLVTEPEQQYAAARLLNLLLYLVLVINLVFLCIMTAEEIKRKMHLIRLRNEKLHKSELETQFDKA
jgi:TRAP-type C4-dicarboxylate transport system permease small subunit